MAEPSAYHCITRCFSSCWRTKATSDIAATGGLIQSKEDGASACEPDREDASRLVSTSPRMSPVGNGCCILGRGEGNTPYAYTHAPSQNGDCYSTCENKNRAQNGHSETAETRLQEVHMKSSYGETFRRDASEPQHYIDEMNSNTNQRLLNGDFDTSKSVTKTECETKTAVAPVPTGAKHGRKTNINNVTVNSVSSLSNRKTHTTTDLVSIPDVSLVSGVSPNVEQNSTENEDAGIGVKDILIDKASSHVELQDKSGPSTTCGPEFSCTDEDGQRIKHFRGMIETESDRLNSLIETWEDMLIKNNEINEEVQDEIRSVNGQTRLVISERFTQFSSLVDMAEKHLGRQKDEHHNDKTVTLSDLQGFWDMIYFQVEDVLHKFQRLDQVKDHGWNLESVIHYNDVKPQKQSFNPAKPPKKVPTKKLENARLISQEEKARKQAARKRLAEARKRMAAQNKTQNGDRSENIVRM